MSIKPSMDGDVLDCKHAIMTLAENRSSPAKIRKLQSDIEKAFYLYALQRQKNNICATARYLGINRNTLTARVRRMGIWESSFGE